MEANFDESSPPIDPEEQQRVITEFGDYFKAAQVKYLQLEELPPEVLSHFEGRSQLYIHPRDYKPGNFTQLLQIKHFDRSTTYVARQTKKYETEIEEDIHLVDVGPDGAEQGHGDIRKNISSDDPYFVDKPFVGQTTTEEKYRRKGLATRRLLMMNALSHTYFGLPINSDTNISPEAKSIWKGFVDSDLAVKYKEGEKDRFVFKD